jgi:(p)ppGpp synthase/HD superfamily hydrolase
MIVYHRDNIVENAMILAANAHRGEFRKQSNTPYILHPMQVATLVMQHGGSIEQIAGAWMHDVIEDCGADYELAIQFACGKHVLRLVQACSDCAPATGEVKAPWQDRKNFYIDGIKNHPGDALLIIACDKLANITDSVEGLKRGEDVMSLFNCTRDQTLWYYCAVFKQLELYGDARVQKVAKLIDAQILMLDALSA